MEWLRETFALVCGQHRFWTLGGVDLPFCQRCTGLYVGAAIAVVLWAVFRPRPTYRFLAVHGLLIVLMVPFGFHLVPQNAAVRTLSGQLFAVGLVGYLGLLPGSRLGWWRQARQWRPWAYGAGVLAGVAAVQVAVGAGGRLAGGVLAWVGFAGLGALAVLAAVNLGLIPGAVWREIRSIRGGTG